MALPLLERYSLNQAINFIKNRTGEQLTKEDLLEYAITGHLKIGIFIDVFCDTLSKIGSNDCQNLELRHFDSPILHSNKYPEWANPKSFLHKQIARFCDGFVDIDANLLFMDENQECNAIAFTDEDYKSLENDIDSLIENLKNGELQSLKPEKEVIFNTKDSNDDKYEKISWLSYGKLNFKGFVYLQPYLLNQLKTFAQLDENVANLVFDRLSFDSVEFPNSEIKAFLSFELNMDKCDHLDDEEYEKAQYNKISINDLLIFKDDLLKFINEDNREVNLNDTLYLLGEVINAVKSKNKKWTQSTIIDEILTQRQGEQRSGLEQRKIEEYFSTANKLFKAK
ncbi:hypothetical protein Q7409_01840 [Glaesserella parasuis]|uniref:hypothetical protein n=1 Tax=Glaesserella parasuis TaxID=738 RepID=UPI00243663B1|nr:hypothetical protein [Glaesserella parasuis]MDE3987354.1 hypothetical protein [Glaesserella parasuis]MDG6372639.1 hypothetical protein [Glaesserella parasuis]MDG6444562.1 hypothetical protein [Glaesserella parasuis]MDO9974748.1 hypothetical protein [Glaesserella parasuis]MDP0040593.1 hypothetical protein [Glaesserella parasuis]